MGVLLYSCFINMVFIIYNKLRFIYFIYVIIFYIF